MRTIRPSVTAVGAVAGFVLGTLGCGLAAPPEPELHRLVPRGELSAVRSHLNAGNDLNVRDHMNVTALHLAVARVNKPMVELLIAKGADANAVQDPEHAGFWYETNRRTPLNRAIERGRADLVTLLLRAGAVSSCREEDQSGLDLPPLHQAVRMDDAAVVRALLDGGCHAAPKGARGETAEAYGRRSGDVPYRALAALLEARIQVASRAVLVAGSQR